MHKAAGDMFKRRLRLNSKKSIHQSDEGGGFYLLF